jgi:hypothetical protein
MRWWYVVVRCTRSVTAACIYRKDPPMVTASRNRLALSLSKRIRHGPVVKINGKRRSQTCEALGQILVNYSRIRRASAPITSPRPGERARPCVSPFLLCSTHL